MEGVRHVLALDKDDLLRVLDGRGVSVYLASGELWLTQENDSRDIMLTAGQSFRLDKNGLTLVHAFERSEVSLCAPRSRELAEPTGLFALVPRQAAQPAY